ncbi:phosphatase PAP2 family protein [Streptococcus gallolyticus]|uniref:phosphatase PAP2 family protein n=1 Tax=Streptococcus hepaticus TaxID=3349163 RepID=UPI001C94F5D6|nr:phosphatase PAP2 family protein [Streptococcus gallolyticus]MBY5042101.1 phosphatase PAP2 family protein [Streptococcus gallolyticus]
MRNYEEVYANMARFLENSPFLKKAVIWLNHYITYVMYLAYPLFLLITFFQGEFQWKWVLVPAVGFSLLSLVRKLINAPRPYEVYTIQPLIEKTTKGNSMPSRHVFSATIISMCFLSHHIGLGGLGLFLSVTLAVCRVLVGVHFPRDVLMGFSLGMLAGSILFMM